MQTQSEIDEAAARMDPVLIEAAISRVIDRAARGVDPGFTRGQVVFLAQAHSILHELSEVSP